jgi:hypothetical protein
MPTQSLDVDPRLLHVPPSRRGGADLFKLHRQIARFGASATGMPAPWAYRGSDGELMLYNGVTRATRIAKLSPGTLIRVEVVGNLGTPSAAADNRRPDSMITAQRQEILQLLERLSELTPDVRFGQLIANLSYLAIGPTNEAIWDMEDQQLLTAIRQHIADLCQRAADVA